MWADHPCSHVCRAKIEVKTLFPSFQTKGREIYEAAIITTSEEPLEKSPEETECEEFGKASDLFLR